jgi:hypothetical protein
LIGLTVNGLLVSRSGQAGLQTQWDCMILGQRTQTLQETGRRGETGRREDRQKGRQAGRETRQRVRKTGVRETESTRGRYTRDRQ